MTSARFIAPVLLLSLLAALALTSAIGAEAASAKGKSKCQRLKGKDRAPARKVKLVKRRNGENGIDLVGCVLPRGRIYTVASGTDYYTETNGYELLKVKSSTVLVRSSSSNQYYSGSSEVLVSLRTGEGQSVSSYCVGGPACDMTRDEYSPVVLINKHGRAVAATVSDAQGTTTLFSFSSRGERQDLDSGPSADVPAASLSLTGDVVSWTHSGLPRSAVVSG
jgi:hypothetical protein